MDNWVVGKAATVAIVIAATLATQRSSSDASPVFGPPTVRIVRTVDGIGSRKLGQLIVSIANNDPTNGLCIPTADLVEVAPQATKYRVTTADGVRLEPRLYEGFMGPASAATYEWIGPGFRLEKAIDLDAIYVAPTGSDTITIEWVSTGFHCVRRLYRSDSEVIRRLNHEVRVYGAVEFHYP